MRGYTQDKDAYLKRLKRIEGQVRGLQRMVESDTYCIDVLTQVSAVTRALQAVALGLVEDHLGHCVMQAIETGGPEADAKVKEASEAIARLVRPRRPLRRQAGQVRRAPLGRPPDLSPQRRRRQRRRHRRPSRHPRTRRLPA